MKKNHKACVSLTGIGAGALLALGLPCTASAQGLGSASLLAITGSSPGQNITSGTSSSSTQLKIEGSSQQEKSQGLGPYVTSSSLSETNYQDYGLYAESINNDAFFYASVSNGGMTDQPVYLDFPQNLQYALEKDGVEQSYTNKSYLTESGSYVFHIYVVKDKSKPLSEQTISEATFHFRIQQKLPGAGQSSSGGSSNSGSSSSSGSLSSSYSSPSLNSSISSGSQNISNALNSVNDAVNSVNSATSTAEKVYQGIGDAADGLTIGLNGQVEDGTSSSGTTEPSTEETAESTESLETEETETEAAGTEETALPEDLLVSTDSDALQTLLGINVPNGMLSNTAVSFDPDNVTAMGASVAVLRNGESYDIPTDGSFNEVGSYTLLVREKDSTKPVPYSFKLVNSVSSDLGLYTVPESLTVKSLTINGDVQSLAGLSADTGVPQIDFSQEGSYDLTMEAENGYTYHFVVDIDNTAPTCEVSTKTNRAEISYLSQDIDHVVLIKDGGEEQQYSGTELNRITEPGRYTVKVYDQAGNVTTLNFRVRKGLNLAAIIAVLLVIGLGASAVIFVRRIRQNASIK